jgi:predicted RNase H-like HicB family nuclease
MIIQWDSRDDIYVVTVPELPGCMSHGQTYEGAVKNALEAIELWIETALDARQAVPPPRVAA